MNRFKNRWGVEQWFWFKLIVIFILFLFFAYFYVYFINIQFEIGTLVFMLLMSLFMFLLYFSLQKIRTSEHHSNQQAEHIRQIESLYTAFRSERHDMINHVHTIYGLLTVNKSDEAQKYLQTLIKEIRSLNQVLVSDNPALSALLQVKSAIASRQLIEMELTFYDSLASIPWTATEMNTVIGNIINNAIEAFDSIPADSSGERRIWLHSERTEGQTVLLTIGNNGPVIPETIQHEILESGVSGKAGHSGIGLYSACQVLQRIGGTIQIESDEKRGTRFQLKLPLQSVE